MATKPAKEATDADTAPPKSKKKMIIIILAAVVLVGAVATAGMLYILKKNTAAEDGETAAAKKEEKKPQAPPQFLPLENMVVNLTNEGGARFMQLGITLQVEDHKASDAVKAYMPAIRNGVLLLASQRTAEELLSPSGKERLSQDILKLVRDVSGAKNEKGESSVQAVLFSSFIVQ